MGEGKNDSKVKLLLFFIFIIFAILLIAFVVRMMNDLFQGIDQKNYEFKCTNINLNVQNIQYEQGSLSFIVSQGAGLNISKITLLTDSGNYSYDIGGAGVGNLIPVRFDNVTLTKSFSFAVNDCPVNETYNLP